MRRTLEYWRRLRLLLPVCASIVLAVPALSALPASADTPTVGLRHSAIVEIGGAGSALGGDEWAPLQSLLRSPPLGYAQDDVLAYSYHVDVDPLVQAPYSMAETCQPLEQSEQHLADFLTALQQQHLFDAVTLVGHSQGGVLAMDVLGSRPDLSGGGNPFIRAVVALDSPLNGLDWTRAFVWEALGSDGPCTSVRELVARHARPQLMQDYYLANVGAAIDRGVQVRVVVNDADLYLTPASQRLVGLPVTIEVDVEGPVNNHAAALYDPATLAQMVGFIGPQGS